MEPHAGLRGELTASIARTLVAEARRNELVIARVRGFGVLGMVGLDVWLWVVGSQLGPLQGMLALGTLAMLGWSVGVYALLRAGRWWPALPWGVTAIDALFLAGREGAVSWALGPEHFVASQDLATVVGIAALLMVTGAFRLQGRAVALSGGLGVGIYLAFATWTGLDPFFMAIHLLALGAVGLACLGLTRIVARAVRSEVTRMTVSRLLPATVLEAAHADPLALLSEARSLDATIVITDLRGFTRWAEHRDPLEVLGFLNTIQGALAEVIDRHGGTVDKFMGDGMLAVFGAPIEHPDHAERAVRAATDLLAVSTRTGEVKLGIGIHSGSVVVGCLGSGVRMEFTVLGDTVNTASRLESATKEHGVPVLVSATTAERVQGRGLVPAGRIALRGRDAEVDVFTLA